MAIGELKVSIRYRILMARERDRGDRSLLFHSWRHYLTIFSTVLLFSRAARSLIRAMVSISGEKKRKEKENKTFLAQVSLFPSPSFFLYHAQLFPLSRHERGWSSTVLLAKRPCRSCSQLCNRRTSGDTDRRRRTFCLSLKSIRCSWLIVHAGRRCRM